MIGRPDTAGYRFRRFLGRNRIGAAAAALVAVTLVGATAVTAWQSSRRATALRVAEAERARATRITDFLLGIFRATNPNETRGRTVTARELLDQAAARVRRDLAADSAALADMELAIGRAYALVGLWPTADSMLARVVEARRAASPANPLEIAEALEWHGRIRMTRGRLEEGVAMMREVVALREQRLGPNAPELAPAYQRIAMASTQLDPDDTSGVARRHFRRALELLRSADSVDHRAVAEVLRHLGSITLDVGDPAEAAALLREALEAGRKATDEEDPFLFNLKESLALGLKVIGKADSAIAIHRELLETRRRVFGPEHNDVSFSLYNLGRELGRVGQFEEAIALLTECVAMRARLFGPEHHLVAYAEGALGRALARSGDRTGGLARFQRAALISERALGLANIVTLEYQEEVALLQVALGRRDAALATLAGLVARGYRKLDREELRPLAGDPRFERLRAAGKQTPAAP